MRFANPFECPSYIFSFPPIQLTRASSRIARKIQANLSHDSRTTGKIRILEYLETKIAREKKKKKQAIWGWAARQPSQALFSFLYLKKIKILKIYVRFEIFQNYPQSPPIGQQVLSVIFFLQICNEVPGKKKFKGACRPPLGRPMGPAHRRDRGACHPPSGDRGLLPYISILPQFLPHLSLKIQKKREG